MSGLHAAGAGRWTAAMHKLSLSCLHVGIAATVAAVARLAAALWCKADSPSTPASWLAAGCRAMMTTRTSTARTAAAAGATHCSW